MAFSWSALKRRSVSLAALYRGCGLFSRGVVCLWLWVPPGRTGSGVAFGLPQGSILGPLLYILYTADLSMILSPLGVVAHQYADDTQAYVHGVASESISVVEKMLLVSDVIGAWLSSNRLRLNPGKTQFIWVGGCVQLSKIDLSILLEPFPGVLFSTTVRDLVVTLEHELTLSRHVGSVCRSCFYRLRQIRSVRRSLTFKAARTLMHAFICSRVDYCSAIYSGVALAHVDQLQSVLNAAARLIGGIPKFGHISEFIRAELHWLPMHRRIAFKILMLMRNC